MTSGRRLAGWAALLLLVGVTGCRIGEGEGSARGLLHVTGCVGEGDDWRDQIPYDLSPSFFAAEPLDDPTGFVPGGQLRIRLQSSGAKVENVDALVIDVLDIAALGEQLGEWVPVYAAGDESPVDGTLPASPVRITLSLMRTCARKVPNVEPGVVLADLDPDPTMGGQSKIRFTQLGGKGCEDLEGGGVVCDPPNDAVARVSFGQRIRAQFDLYLMDKRPDYLGPAYRRLAGGHLVGYFDFIMQRGRVAQAFP